MDKRRYTLLARKNIDICNFAMLQESVRCTDPDTWEGYKALLFKFVADMDELTTVYKQENK